MKIGEVFFQENMTKYLLWEGGGRVILGCLSSLRYLAINTWLELLSDWNLLLRYRLNVLCHVITRMFIIKVFTSTRFKSVFKSYLNWFRVMFNAFLKSCLLLKLRRKTKLNLKSKIFNFLDMESSLLNGFK